MKLSDKAKAIISAIAPTIGTALGGPFGGMAGSILSSYLGGADAEKAILSGDPVVFANAKKAEQDFLAQMRELDIKEEDLHQRDRASARELFKVNQWPQIALSGLFIGGYFYILDGLLSGDVQIADGIKDTALLLLGLLTREVPTIMQFWFGSSIGSKSKDSLPVSPRS